MARGDFSTYTPFKSTSLGSAYQSLPLTVVTWLKSPAGTTEPFICLGHSSGSRRAQLQLGSSAGWMTAWIVGAANRSSSKSGFAADVWQHAAFILNGTTTATTILLYLNGFSASVSTSTDMDLETIDTIVLGSNWNGSAFSSSKYAGYLAESAVYSAALSDSEIGELNAGYSPLCVRPDKLIGYWPLFGRQDSSEEDWAGSIAVTSPDVPLRGDHPRIIYPRRRTIILPSTAASGTTGTSSGTFTLTGSAAGTVAVAGASSGAFTLTGTAAGAVAVGGASVGSFNLAGSGVAAVLVSASSAQTITLAGATEGAVTASGVPVLSAATVVSIATTSATPRVTLTF